MKLKLFFAFFFLAFTVFSQHSENFMSFAEKLIPIDTTSFQENYRDGSIKEKGTLIEYVVGDVSEKLYAGEYFQYWKNGNLKMDAKFDEFGNLLTQKCYNKDGSICSEFETLKIDTTAKELLEFLIEDYHLEILTHDKNYSYSLRPDTPPFLKREGQMINDKKTGIWKVYSNTGEVIKEKVY